MELYEESGSFAPDRHLRDTQTQPGTISASRRRWRAPALVTSMAVVAGLCLYTGSAANAAEKPRVAAVSALSVKPAVTTGLGGVRGAFNIYDGPGGSIEFWFDPSTGQLTLATGSGVGIGSAGVIGTYAPGTEPAPGTYLYASATLAAGTVASTNVSGTYQLENGVFSGSVSGTIEGRTVTLNSDGVTGFSGSVVANSSAVGWSAAVGVKFVYEFNMYDVLNYIWDAIKNFITGDYSLTDNDDTGYSTYAYSDDNSTNGTFIPSTGSTGSDGSSGDGSATTGTTSDDSADGSSDESDDDSGPADDAGECRPPGCDLA